MLSGCRTGEARALKVKDVDIENKLITISATFSGSVVQAKKKRAGVQSRLTIPIHPEIFEYYQR